MDERFLQLYFAVVFPLANAFKQIDFSLLAHESLHCSLNVISKTQSSFGFSVKALHRDTISPVSARFDWAKKIAGQAHRLCCVPV